MIRLLLAVATAVAVVWAAGGNLGSLIPDAEVAREVIERSARTLKEEVLDSPELATEIAERPEFGPEAPDEPAPAPAPPRAGQPPGHTPGQLPDWSQPLDAERAASVRLRLDRVMTLAGGDTR